MPLAPGRTLGPYELVGLLGAGGMGEVWRARDPRLGRDVAIKVLPDALARDPERLARFKREAQILAALSHPHVGAIYGLEEADGVTALVLELIEGPSLADRMGEGPIPLDEALPLALEIASGLEAAHERGIVHRDLKPANVKLTPEGRAKVLDFGLAKASPADASSPSSPRAHGATVTTGGTVAGMVLGTAAYMSPEQARAKPADRRTDVWAFGALLFEMLAGVQAFPGETASDVMAAILTGQADLGLLPPSTPPAVRALVRRCLVKDPAHRLQAIGDARVVIEEVLEGKDRDGMLPPAPAPARSRSRPLALAAVFALGLAVGAGALLVAGARRAAAPPALTYTQKTFRQEAIFNARFAPDGRTIVYTAANDERRPEIFILRPEYQEPVPLGIARSHLLSVSSQNELAILTKARYLHHRVFRGTLARVPLGGGTPRELLENVRDADWSPDGSQLAIVREVEGKDRLEFPIGKVLHESSGYLSNVRISPAGDRIAFMEHPWRGDDRGGVSVVDLDGRHKVLAYGFAAEEGLAWAPVCRELLFSAWLDGGASYQVSAVDLEARVRHPLTLPGDVTVQDVAAGGTWLVTSDESPSRVMGRAPGALEERDLSWLDSSGEPVISGDGSVLALSDWGRTSGANYGVYLRRTDGSPAQHLGEGSALDLSPDGGWVLVNVPSKPARLMLYPTGPGEPRRLDGGELEAYSDGKWFEDGRSLFLCGNAVGQAPRCYVRTLESPALRPVTPEGVDVGIVAPDGKSAIVRRVTGEALLCPLDGGEPRPLPFITPDDRLSRFSPDGTEVWVRNGNRGESVDLAGGRRETLVELGASRGAGMIRFNLLALADDPRAYAYSANEYSSQLFLIEGAR